MKRLSLLLLVGSILVFSCKKTTTEEPEPSTPTNNNTNTNPNCDVSVFKTDQGLITKSFEYDASGRLIKIQDYNSGVLDPTDYDTYTYESSLVIIKDGNQNEVERYLLNGKGYVTTVYRTKPTKDTIELSYDNNDYLKAEIRRGITGVGNGLYQTTSYIISGDNIINRVVVSEYSTGAKDTSSTTFEYSTDLAKNQINGDYDFPSYLKFAGKDKKNLISKTTTVSAGGATNVKEYVYEKNTEGKVTKRTMTQTGTTTSTVVRLYEYCK